MSTTYCALNDDDKRSNQKTLLLCILLASSFIIAATQIVRPTFDFETVWHPHSSRTWLSGLLLLVGLFAVGRAMVSITALLEDWEVKKMGYFAQSVSVHSSSSDSRLPTFIVTRLAYLMTIACCLSAVSLAVRYGCIAWVMLRDWGIK